MISLWIALAYLVALLPALALAQNATFIAGFVSSLFTLGYGDFAEALVRINSTSEGQAILSELSSGGNFTVFVPSNQACEASSSSFYVLFMLIIVDSFKLQLYQCDGSKRYRYRGEPHRVSYHAWRLFRAQRYFSNGGQRHDKCDPHQRHFPQCDDWEDVVGQ